MNHEHVIKILRAKALRDEYRNWTRIDVKRVLDDYYSLTNLPDGQHFPS